MPDDDTEQFERVQAEGPFAALSRSLDPQGHARTQKTRDALDRLERLGLKNQETKQRHEHLANLIRTWTWTTILVIFALAVGVGCSVGVVAVIGSLG